jgi:hypothetical protein
MKVKFRDAGRPKGKRYFPVSLTLTQEQIDYLQKQPNASELIRRILDDLINARKDIDAKLGVISLNKQMEELREHWQKLSDERHEFMMNNKKNWEHHEHEFRGETLYDITWLKESPIDKALPKPLDTKDAKVAFRVLKGYDEVLNSIERKIEDIKKQILAST